MIQGLRDLSYEESLKECDLILETRKLRGNQIELKKINRYENIDRNIFSHPRKTAKLEDMREQ